MDQSSFERWGAGEDVGVFLGTLAATASVVAVSTAYWSIWRSWKNRRVERDLTMRLGRLRRLNKRLTGIVITLDQRVSAGTGCFGSQKNNFDNPITGHLWYYAPFRYRS